MDITNILDFAKMGIACLSALLSIILAFINFKKSKKKLQDKDVEVCESNERAERTESILKDMKKVCDESCVRIDILKKWIPEAMAKAEQETLVSGATKKQLAIGYIMQKCCEQSVDYKEIAKEVNEQIENLIGLTKKVNYISLEKEEQNEQVN